LIVFSIGLATLLGTSLLLVMLPVGMRSQSESWFIAECLGLMLNLAIMLLLVRRILGTRPLRESLAKLNGARAWMISGIFVLIATTLAGLFAHQIYPDQMWEAPAQLLEQPFWALMLSLLAELLLGPLLEEIHFRWILYKTLCLKVPEWLAVIGSSLAFALLHPGSPSSMVSIFALGLVLAASVCVTRSVLPAVCAHAAWNALMMISVSWKLL
jgi:membrane protease YdiL (CAAX protease family)